MQINKSYNKEHELQQYLKDQRSGLVAPLKDGDYWSEEERKRLEYLHSCGVGISKMSLEFDRSESSVIHQLIRKKLLTNPGKNRHKRRQPDCYCEKCPSKDECTVKKYSDNQKKEKYRETCKRKFKK